ncbi:hypothetical protein OESDEN_04264 [Oesophagostomum dentatum]|uniref:Uncharacterized protein n=1 Tax=Oesophagostomum dentatum TaxID=61180 RepID=A0A0B1TI62_OESDE|nr:hypothetical protein OESDEN_04264 [Oesophagostomum dentatum]
MMLFTSWKNGLWLIKVVIHLWCRNRPTAIVPSWTMKLLIRSNSDFSPPLGNNPELLTQRSKTPWVYCTI